MKAGDRVYVTDSPGETAAVGTVTGVFDSGAFGRQHDLPPLSDDMPVIVFVDFGDGKEQHFDQRLLTRIEDES